MGASRAVSRCSVALVLVGCTGLASAADEQSASPFRRSTFFAAIEATYFEAVSTTGGRITMTEDDTDTAGTDLSLLGGSGFTESEYAPRANFGWRWNHTWGLSYGAQARFFTFENSFKGPATIEPGTTPQTNFTTETETGSLDIYTADVEAAVGYSRWGVTIGAEGGKRWGWFSADATLGTFGVFTTGNFQVIDLANGSAFRGEGWVWGASLAYKIPKVPLSIFAGIRRSELDGASDSFARVAGALARSPSPPLLGAATVTRNNADATDMEMREFEAGVRADFGSPSSCVHAYAQLSYSESHWRLDGPPTGGAGFGGTLTDITVTSFSSAGLGSVNLEGFAVAVGMVF